MKIGLDVMGGDNTEKGSITERAVKGAVNAIKQADVSLVLFGHQPLIEEELSKYKPYKNLEIIPSLLEQTVKMGDKPEYVYREKKASSLMLGIRSLHLGYIDAFVTAGNTAASVYSTTTYFRDNGKLVDERLDRLCLAIQIPTKIKNKHALIGDVGAGKAKAKDLAFHAIMLNAYAESLDIKNPKIALLNIGSENGKGNSIINNAYQLIRRTGLNYFEDNSTGEIFKEPTDIFSGVCDIFVCDGFTGNIMLKSAEGAIDLTKHFIREEVSGSLLYKFGGFFLKPVFTAAKQQLNPSYYGGGVLLGLPYPFIVTHGKADSEAINNSILLAEKCRGIGKKLEEKLSKYDLT